MADSDHSYLERYRQEHQEFKVTSATFKDGGLSLQTRTTEKEQVAELLGLGTGFQLT